MASLAWRRLLQRLFWLIPARLGEERAELGEPYAAVIIRVNVGDHLRQLLLCRVLAEVAHHVA